MSDLLINGKEAYNAVLDGKRVEWLDPSGNWNTFTDSTAWAPCELMSGKYKFRIKPRVISINNIEVPAPFKPKIGDKYWILEVSDPNSYSYISSFQDDKQDKNLIKLGAWRTEKEIKQVVDALQEAANREREQATEYYTDFHCAIAERDALQKRISVYEKHVGFIKNIHESEFNSESDASWILGNLDGFFECLEIDLKSDKND